MPTTASPLRVGDQSAARARCRFRLRVLSNPIVAGLCQSSPTISCSLAENFENQAVAATAYRHGCSTNGHDTDERHLFNVRAGEGQAAARGGGHAAAGRRMGGPTPMTRVDAPSRREVQPE